jgi:tetratricopeptide (TPR) repeat protein
MFAGYVVSVFAAGSFGEEPQPAAVDASPAEQAAIDKRLEQVQATFARRAEVLKQESEIRAQLAPIERAIATNQNKLNSVESEVRSLEREKERENDDAKKGNFLAGQNREAKIRGLRDEAGVLKEEINRLNQQGAPLLASVNKLYGEAAALKAQWWAFTDAQGALTRKEQQAVIAPLTEWIAADKGNACARLTRGFAYWKLGDLKKALGDFNAALDSAGPLMTTVLSARGGLLCAMRKQKEGMADFAKALKINKQDPLISLFRGRAHLAAGKYQQANNEFRAAVKFDPKNPEVYRTWALLDAACPEARFRNGKRAVERATRACELTDWKQWQALAALAAAHAENHDFDEAVKQITLAAVSSFGENQETCLAQKKEYENQEPLRLHGNEFLGLASDVALPE